MEFILTLTLFGNNPIVYNECTKSIVHFVTNMAVICHTSSVSAFLGFKTGYSAAIHTIIGADSGEKQANLPD
jgi:hypothetical protein